MFESTGAYSKETAKWFGELVKADKKVNPPALVRSVGASFGSTFSANSFSSFWSQRLSMVQATHHAESLLQVSQESLPSDVGYWVPGPAG